MSPGMDMSRHQGDGIKFSLRLTQEVGSMSASSRLKLSLMVYQNGAAEARWAHNCCNFSGDM